MKINNFLVMNTIFNIIDYNIMRVDVCLSVFFINEILMAQEAQSYSVNRFTILVTFNNVGTKL